jgi:hypothetical protein
VSDGEVGASMTAGVAVTGACSAALVAGGAAGACASAANESSEADSNDANAELTRMEWPQGCYPDEVMLVLIGE